MLHALNFPHVFIELTMECVKTTRYIIALTGGMFGSIEGQRGLRQGDPISPLLFVICMEYFNRIMIWVSEEKSLVSHKMQRNEAESFMLCR